jgi:hypothetical protein
MNSNFLKVISKESDECKVCASESRLFDVVDFHGNVDVDPNAKKRKEIFPISRGEIQSDRVHRGF